MENLHLICPLCGKAASRQKLIEAMAGLSVINCVCHCGQKWKLLIGERDVEPQAEVEPTLEGLTAADLLGDGWREMEYYKFMSRAPGWGPNTSYFYCDFFPVMIA
jgi:hypothetical protein